MRELPTLPTSSTQTYLTTSTTPVSSSISTIATCEPNGKLKSDGLKYSVASRPGSIPGGRSHANQTHDAMSWSVLLCVGSVLREPLPSSKTTSDSAAFSM